MATNPIADDKERISVQFTKVQKREYTRLAQALNLDLSKYIRMIIEKYHEQGNNASKEAITVQTLKNELLRNAANDCDYLRERLQRIKNSLSQVLNGNGNRRLDGQDNPSDAWESSDSEDKDAYPQVPQMHEHPKPTMVNPTHSL